MYEEYMENKLLFLSANVVNHPLLSYVHARMRAIKAFYEKDPYSWIKYENNTELDETPANNNTYDAWGTWLNCGKCAAIVHYSFLYHAERNNFHVYDFNFNGIFILLYTLVGVSILF